jgi:hypothetical protein
MSGVTSLWDTQWNGVSWATAGFAGPHVGEEAGPGLCHTKIKKGGKEDAGRAELGFQLGLAHCQIGIRNSFSFSNLFIICKLI